MSGRGRCPLVAGECVQGRLGTGPHFLITTPIDHASEATFEIDLELSRVEVEPACCTKARGSVERYLDDRRLPPGGRLRIERSIADSLGFGTSTADISASLRAAADAWERKVAPGTISRYAIDLEPTDGSMYPGSVAYAHRRGELLESFGPTPPFRALAVIEGEGIDTVAFDLARRDYYYSAADEQRLRYAWSMVREAIHKGSIGPMAEAGVISAEINQQLLPKTLLKEMLEAAGHLDAAGLFVAHSGSIITLVFDPAAPRFPWRWDQAVRFVEDLIGDRTWLPVGHAHELDDRDALRRPAVSAAAGHSL